MQFGGARHLHLLQHLRMLKPRVLFLLSASRAFNWSIHIRSKITKQECLSRGKEYLPSNHVNHLISVCLNTYSDVTAWHDSFGIHAKSRMSHRENGKATWEDLGNTAVWEGHCAVTLGPGSKGCQEIGFLSGGVVLVYIGFVWLIRQIPHLHAHRRWWFTLKVSLKSQERDRIKKIHSRMFAMLQLLCIQSKFF